MSVACAGLPVPETPAQRLFVLQNHYAILAEAAATYCESPQADPEVVRRIQELDRSIYRGIQQARMLLQAGNDSTSLETRFAALSLLVAELRAELAGRELPTP